MGIIMGLFGKKKGITLEVEGMTCGHCAMRVEKALGSVKGVKHAKVDLDGKKAMVTIDPDKADEASLVKAVEEAGYKARSI